MIDPVEVKPKEGYRIWLSYSDGTSGEVDLSHLAGVGVFQKWESPNFFQDARIVHRAIAWGDDIDLCADALYMEITGLSPDEALPLIYAPDSRPERTTATPLVQINPTHQT